VVAIDTPDNLTDRLQGAQTLYLQVDAAAGVDVPAALKKIPGVTSVTPADARDTIAGFEIECQRGQDRRREVASFVVTSGWGLLELRPTRLSLEEIFLQLAAAPGLTRRNARGLGASPA
jgi:ABC-2 type transport system ATP-binding protein